MYTTIKGFLRLKINYEVSSISPVVVGTWVTVDSLMEYVRNGMTIDKILNRYPEIDVDDFMEAIRYTLTNTG